MGQICSASPLLCIFSSKLHSDYWYLPGNSLPALGGNPNSMTMSGISGGSATTTQMHTIYSDDIKGVGLMIGGVYGEPSLAKKNFAQQGISIAKSFESTGDIDSTSNLAGTPVWIYSGIQDTLYGSPNQEAQLDYYNYFGANTELVTFDAGHMIPTIFAEGDYYINGYDTVGTMLDYVLTNLQVDPISELKEGDTNFKENGVLRRFSQLEFLDTTIFDPHGLADYGYVYYPYRCIDGTVESCKVHMILPGCHMTVVLGGYRLMNDFGYGQYASANDLIIVYPQQKFDWYNFYNCMGFKGHSSWWMDSYLTNQDPQMKALRGMLDRVVQPRDSSKWDYVDMNENIYDGTFVQNFMWTPWLFVKGTPEYIGATTAAILWEIQIQIWKWFE